MIVITGASKGIGKYLFDTFIKSGVNTIGTYNSTLPGVDNKVLYYKVDITETNEVNNWIDSIKSNLHNIVLLNCAGISYNSYAHKADIQKWKDVISVNLVGSFQVIRQLLPLMREQGYGRIINFSSVVAKVGTPGVSAYAASKSALWGLSKSIAVENALKGITVNCINLGYVNAGMIDDVPTEYKDSIKTKIPINRFCELSEVYQTVRFLIDNEYINGSSIDLNGGLL